MFDLFFEEFEIVPPLPPLRILLGIMTSESITSQVIHVD